MKNRLIFTFHKVSFQVRFKEKTVIEHIMDNFRGTYLSR